MRVHESIDALAYASADAVPASLRHEAETRIAAEMGTMAREGVSLATFERRLPSLPAMSSSTLFAQELQRVESGKESSPAIDTDRARMDEPAEGSSLEEWERALANAEVQYEHTQTRILNLELLEKYGVSAWKVHLQHLERMEANLRRHLSEQKEAVEAINQARRRDHASADAELSKLSAQYQSLVQRTADIRAACESMVS